MQQTFCPFDKIEFSSPAELLEHLKKCIKGRKKLIFFCQNSLSHVFSDRSEFERHKTDCNLACSLSKNIRAEISKEFIVDFSSVVKLQSYLKYQNLDEHKQQAKTKLYEANDRIFSFQTKPASGLSFTNFTELQTQSLLPIKNAEEKPAGSGKQSSPLVEVKYANLLKGETSQISLQPLFQEIQDKRLTFSSIDFISSLTFETTPFVICSEFLKSINKELAIPANEFLIQEPKTQRLFEDFSLRACDESDSLLLFHFVGSDKANELKFVLKVGNLGLWVIPNGKSDFSHFVTNHQYSSLNENSNELVRVSLQKDIEDHERAILGLEEQSLWLAAQIKELEAEAQAFDHKKIGEDAFGVQSELVQLQKVNKDLIEQKAFLDRKVIEIAEKEIIYTLSELEICKANRFREFEEEMGLLRQELAEIELENCEMLKASDGLKLREKKKKEVMNSLRQGIKTYREKGLEVQTEISKFESLLIEKEKPAEEFMGAKKSALACFSHCCLICFKRIANCVCFPCQHFSKICYQCLSQSMELTKTCLICRRNITKVVKVNTGNEFQGECE